MHSYMRLDPTTTATRAHDENDPLLYLPIRQLQPFSDDCNGLRRGGQPLHLNHLVLVKTTVLFVVLIVYVSSGFFASTKLNPCASIALSNSLSLLGASFQRRRCDFMVWTS